MTMFTRLASLLLAFPLLASAVPELNPVERKHLQLYASFDESPQPDVARNGVKLRLAGKLISQPGKAGQCLQFSAHQQPGDLLYDLGHALKGNTWTIAMWVKLHPQEGKGNPRIRHSLFRTNMGWDTGNAFAGFDCWHNFDFVQLDKAQKYKGIRIPGRSIPRQEWTHLTFTCDNGKHNLYINGYQATYSYNRPAARTIPAPSVLRIGSMDYRAKDQLNGLIDEVKLFDIALDSNDILTIMNTKPSIPTKEIVLFVPFDGQVDPLGTDDFNADQLVFNRGKVNQGVDIRRHGYDRRGQLTFKNLQKLDQKALSCACYFIPRWDPANDRETHGLLHASAGQRQLAIVKQKRKLLLTITAGQKSQTLSLPANLLTQGKPSLIAAAYDHKTRQAYLAIDGTVTQQPLNLHYSAEPPATGTLIVGDTKGGDTYSHTQAEGTIDELILMTGFHTPKALAAEQQAQAQKTKEQKLETMTFKPVTETEAKLWDLNGAETIETSTRRKITLNALWRVQLTDRQRPFDHQDWIYLAVPGRYSGQANGMTDCEFLFRDKNLKVMPRNATYNGKSPYSYTRAIFQRTFIPPNQWKGQHIALLLDELSRSQKGTVFLNQKRIATLGNGRFYEIRLNPKDLHFDQHNVITIETVDSGQYWNWRGIKGNVWLDVKPKIHLRYAWVETDLKRHRALVHATVANQTRRPVNLMATATFNGEGARPGEFTKDITVQPSQVAQVTIEVPWKTDRLWTPETPYLFGCNLSLKNGEKLVDQLPTFSFGLRDFRIKGQDYYLNNKKIHLFNHEGWANSTSDLEEARKTARLLKRMGYNAVRTNFPAEAKDNYPENVMRVCDEEGLLQLVGLDGVTGREFALWNNPDTRRTLQRNMSALIRKWRAHPSVVMYFLSSNFLGYGWDYHPRKMADGYLPEFQKRKANICLQGADIMRQYDNTRPFFFQAGGNFGEIITNNSYFCWWPQTERNAWPAEWNKIGVKPLHIIETSFPYYRSFYGMDLKYPGFKPLFCYENLARYYGPDVYRQMDPDLLQATELSTRGKDTNLHHDIPLLQRLRSDLIQETIPYWRSLNISGICPFAELNYAFQKHAPYHTHHVPKAWNVTPRDFRTIGWNPDIRKMQYQSDVNPEKPLPVRAALRKALAPKLMLIAGSHNSPVDQTHNLYEGSQLKARIMLMNDTPDTFTTTVTWTLLKQQGTQEITLSPGDIKEVPLVLTIPKVNRKTRATLTATATGWPKTARHITIFPRPEPLKCQDIALYDTKGHTRKTLRTLNIRLQNAEKLTDLSHLRALVIARESLNQNFMDFARKHHLKHAVDQGGLNLLILEQTPKDLNLLGLKTMPIYTRNIFRSPTGLWNQLDDQDLAQWAGDGTLAPSRQMPPPETEEIMASPLWHWSNANVVASYPFQRPTLGNYTIHATCGKDLIYTPLWEISSGRGQIIFSQCEISGRTQPDPAAESLLVALLKRAADRPTAERKGTLLTPVNITAEQLPALLEQVSQGATLIPPPKTWNRFQIDTDAQTVRTFDITPAGRRFWSCLTPRDTFLRAPQQLPILKGKDLIPLTRPAFCALRKHGRGTIIFMALPDKPQETERKRGLKQGQDSSTYWSAEILAQRFRQLENLVLATQGKTFPSLAQRLENMRVPADKINLAGTWKLKADPRKIGVKNGWQYPQKQSQAQDWKNVTVPGYYNAQHPELNDFKGFVWCKKTVKLPAHLTGKKLVLNMGAVDDLDVTFVNGEIIGQTGEDTQGYWEASRRYVIPPRLTATGTLHIAVQINNLRGNGGIVKGVTLTTAGGNRQQDSFPYSNHPATYHTETHVRW